MKHFTPKETEQYHLISYFFDACNVISNQKDLGCILLLWQTPAKNNSQFMGHARASDLTQSLIKRLKDLDYANKMVQVSMYGPNVIWSLLDNLAIHQKKENASEPDLVNTGSCCLHVVRRSFGTASKKVDWNLKASLFFFFFTKTLRTVLRVEQIT